RAMTTEWVVPAFAGDDGAMCGRRFRGDDDFADRAYPRAAGNRSGATLNVSARPFSHFRTSRMSALFTPIQLRELKLKNRIMVAPMCQYSAQNGEANDWH